MAALRKADKDEVILINNMRVLLVAHERYPTWYHLVELQRMLQSLANSYVMRIQEDESKLV